MEIRSRPGSNDEPDGQPRERVAADELVARVIAQVPDPRRHLILTLDVASGVRHFWNFFVFGSKATSVFGSRPDSLYHTVPSEVDAIP
jgi:hypothetical protein